MVTFLMLMCVSSLVFKSYGAAVTVNAGGALKSVADSAPKGLIRKENADISSRKKGDKHGSSMDATDLKQAAGHKHDVSVHSAVAAKFMPTSPSQLKTLFGEEKCLDYDLNSHRNVFMYPCHGNKNQLWIIDALQRLKVKYDESKCMTVDTAHNNNVIMETCSSKLEQQWYFNGETLQMKCTATGANLCVDYNTSSNNIAMRECADAINMKQNQRWVLPAADGAMPAAPVPTGL
eukprot:gnl/TRDRNA2_/TRDRNA2_36513_c0_seq1.p1 gnl/TRDRNA2_/TRDRNA2_36513_c0~~gnl/TRDRNA2_/TRDRNA2_36513_c0_seq1.p1  ORF type:complete len:234 (-),score=42.56 gnl/TRDRNA2_/TRDRNA2_36513_c0_seq1:112-813(-)